MGGGVRVCLGMGGHRDEWVGRWVSGATWNCLACICVCVHACVFVCSSQVIPQCLLIIDVRKL